MPPLTLLAPIPYCWNCPAAYQGLGLPSHPPGILLLSTFSYCSDPVPKQTPLFFQYYFHRLYSPCLLFKKRSNLNPHFLSDGNLFVSFLQDLTAHYYWESYKMLWDYEQLTNYSKLQGGATINQMTDFFFFEMQSLSSELHKAQLFMALSHSSGSLEYTYCHLVSTKENLFTIRIKLL